MPESDSNSKRAMLLPEIRGSLSPEFGKLESFSHQNKGQPDTYVSWYDRNVRGEDDNPPVGILLCTERNQSLVEYALAGMDNALFVSRYQLNLPSKETLQAQLETERQRLEGEYKEGEYKATDHRGSQS